MTLEELKALLEEEGLDKQWKKNSSYWAKRFEQLEDALNNKGVEYYHDLERLYQKASNETEKEIAKWYRRYATNEGISFAEARKQLNNNELKEFRMSLKEYIEKGESLDPKWKRELERASTKFHITRLEALKMQMQHQAEVLMGNEAEGVYDLVKGFYTDAYYHSIYEIQKGIGIGFDFAKLDSNAVDKVLSKSWTADGMNFSERIWGKHRPELVKKLHDGLTLNIARGESPDKLIDEVTKAFNVKKSQAANLVQTEKAFFQTTAQYDSFKELDVEMYEITATLDSKTSEICQFMDGKTFSMKDFQPGATAPPFHNRCRTAIAPYFDDEFDFIDERAARDENRQYYTVPSSMKYKEWYKKYVTGGLDQLDLLTNVAMSSVANETYKVYEPQVSNVDWTEYMDVTESTSDIINDVHTELNAFMNTERREKLYLIDSIDNTISFVLEGDKIDSVTVTSEMKKALKEAKENSIIFTHVHPSPTTFSSADLNLIIDYKSIKGYTLECANGDKFILERGKLKSSVFNKFNFYSKYDKIYSKVAKKYPELNDPIKIYDVWDDFMFEVISEVANHYNMVFKKVR